MSARHRQAKKLLAHRQVLIDAAIDVLVPNLAVAAALCRTFNDGWRLGMFGQICGSKWLPGCGRRAP